MRNVYKHNVELPEEMHQAFLKKLKINERESGQQNLKKRRELNSLLKQRKSFLNERFDFTNENVLKFETLSAKLTLIQEQILTKHKYLLDKAKSDTIFQDGMFTGTYIDITVDFMSDFDGSITSLYKTSQIFFAPLDEEETIAHINQNYANYEVQTEPKKQFKHFYQSRLFHFLIQDSHLALQDILLIDKIWHLIDVQYQTCETI